ncbi:hypothetical protein AO263_19065 [Pseudomonas sp. NZIPFR-PS5]|nr:hypothetical protein AO263_19065 [Pseudomonas sp. NZIPFR-PS5]
MLVAPPQSRIGPLTQAERAALIARSPLAGRYDKPVDRESAYEMLLARKVASVDPAHKPAAEEKSEGGFADMAGGFLGGLAGQAVKSAMRQAATQIGRELVRGLMGSLLGGSKKRR